MKEDEWYEEATRSRDGWRDTCRVGMERHTEVQVTQSSAAARLNVRCAPGNLEERVTRRGTSA